MRKTILLLTLASLVLVVSAPLSVSAQDFPEPPPPGERPGAEGFCDFGPLAVPCPFLGTGATGPANKGTFGSFVLSIINTLLLVVGALAVLFLIIGGFRYVTAEGSEERVEAAKKTMWHAILGIMIVILSFSIIAIVTNFLIGGPAGV